VAPDLLHDREVVKIMGKTVIGSIALALLLGACGRSADDGGQSDSGALSAGGTTPPSDSYSPTTDAGAAHPVTGTLDGKAFTARSAIAFRGPWGGSSDFPNGQYLRVFFSDSTKVTCDSLPSIAGGTMVRIEVQDELAKASPDPLDAAHHVLFEVDTPTCESSPKQAVSGSVTLSAVTGSVAGSINATFASGTVTGDFSITLCPSEPPDSSLDCVQP
jgi:hypothetical protein